MWHLFGQEVRDEQTSHATQEFARGYTHGRNVETEVQGKVIEALKEEINHLKVFRSADIERVLVKPTEVLSVKQNESDPKNNGVFLGYEKMSKSQAASLRDQAKHLKSLELWRVLQETLKQKAIEKGHYLSQSFDELLASKMMLHSLGIIKSIVDICESLQIKDE